MFEVELKFILTQVEEARLLQNATFIEQQEFFDVYYDDIHYSLSTNDIWLRTRNDKWVLKIPIHTNNLSLKEQKNSPKLEIEEPNEILKYLNINSKFEISEDLANASIIPLYKFRNIRKKYIKDHFIIDIDKAFFDDFTYETCEIELTVQRESDIDNAAKRIEEFALQHDIKISHVEGRLIEYIKRKNPAHYQKLAT